MLNGTLVLHDVDDAEKFARHVIDRAARKDCLSWPEWKRDELLADAVAHLWELSIRYKPEIGTFSGYAGRFLRFYIIDWIRYREGRTRFQFGPEATHIRLEFRQSGGTYERPRRDVLSLNQPVQSHAYSGAGQKSPSYVTELGETLGSSDLDPASHSDTDLRGALTRGDSPEAWEAAEMGVDDAERTTPRAA